MDIFAEHKAFLRLEIKKLEVNLKQARVKNGVTAEELFRISAKIKWRRELLGALESAAGTEVYGVFWKMAPSTYEPEPEWMLYGEWHKSPGEAAEERERVRQNPRCAAVKIVCKSELLADLTEISMGAGNGGTV